MRHELRLGRGNGKNPARSLAAGTQIRPMAGEKARPASLVPETVETGPLYGTLALRLTSGRFKGVLMSCWKNSRARPSRAAHRATEPPWPRIGPCYGAALPKGTIAGSRRLRANSEPTMRSRLPAASALGEIARKYI